MKQFTNYSSIKHRVAMFLRNTLLPLCATFWLYVFYLSVYEDEKAAILCYVTLVFTVLTIKYVYRGIASVGTSHIYFASLLSQMLIIVGICLAIFDHLWDTALYSVCLGIILQKLKSEVELLESNDDLYLNGQALRDDTETNSFDELPQPICRKTSIQLHEIAQDVSWLQDLIEDHCSSLIISPNENVDSHENTPEKLNEIEGLGKAQNETVSSCKDLTESSFFPPNTVNKSEESSFTPNLKFEGDFQKHSDENETMLHPNQNECLTDKNEPALENSDRLIESESGSNYTGFEDKIFKRLDLQEPELTESATIELDPANVKLEQDENSPEKCFTLNDETVNKNAFLSNCMKEFDTISNRVDIFNDAANNMENILFYENANMRGLKKSSQGDIEKCNFSTLLEHENSSCQQNQSDIKDKCDVKNENSSNNNVHSFLFLNESVDMYKTSSQNIACSDKTNSSNASADVENNLRNETLLTKDKSYIATENLISNIKYKSKNYPSVTITDIHPEIEMYVHQMKYKKINIDDNLKTKTDKIFLKVLPDSERESKDLLDFSKNVDFEADSPKGNETESIAEVINVTNELITKASTTSSSLNVEGVVNRIDTSFIYALGYNVPRMTDSN